MASVAPFRTAAHLWSIFRPQPTAAGLLAAIRETADALRGRSDAGLKSAADELRAIVVVQASRLPNAGGTPAPQHSREMLIPAFALVVESAHRVHGLSFYDTQLLAGMALAKGAIAEMATGEGKTLAAVLPAFLFSLAGGGVHVATPNAYLAERDYQKVAPILQLLGTTVGLVPETVDVERKRAAYESDVTYATGYELGFDYLRDRLRLMNMPRPALGERQLEMLCGRANVLPVAIQPLRRCAIIDEIDSVLIDEACLPLVLSDAAETEDAEAGASFLEALEVAASLREGDHYVVDSQARRVALTVAGRQRVGSRRHMVDGDSQVLCCPPSAVYRLPSTVRRPWPQYVEQALAAKHLFRKDVDYVVEQGRVRLVDEFTGRIFTDRTLRDGLHQAVEAKEGLLPSSELPAAAQISRQRFFRLYDTICGMTGTAAGSRREFRQLYDLDIVQIPLRLPSRRAILPPRFFTDSEAKFRAIVAEVAAMHAAGRPVLIGSRTIRNSELLAQCLGSAGLQFELLNGKQDRAEAEIVARAGFRGAITIATNMAGRGTDIVLGPGVADIGGMHVIGVECHESGRIDRQLVGRAGRQGDPGSGRFFISADDPLLVRHAPRLSTRMRAMPARNGQIDADLAHEVRRAQRAAEAADSTAQRRMLLNERRIYELGQSMFE